MEIKSIKKKDENSTSHHHAARKHLPSPTRIKRLLPIYNTYLRSERKWKRSDPRGALDVWFSMVLPSRISSARLTRYGVAMLPEGHVCVGEVPAGRVVIVGKKWEGVLGI